MEVTGVGDGVPFGGGGEVVAPGLEAAAAVGRLLGGGEKVGTEGFEADGGGGALTDVVGGDDCCSTDSADDKGGGGAPLAPRSTEAGGGAPAGGRDVERMVLGGGERSMAPQV